jgi:glyoxylase-like metal-dependent hydrolase (beta-lactamase superfamily II)
MSASKPYEVCAGVYALGSELVNWYLVEEGGRLTAIDAGLPGFAKRLDDDLSALGFKREQLAALVLTHSDADHTGIAPHLKESGVAVLIHEQDAETLRKPRAKGGEAAPIHMLPQLANPRLWALVVRFARDGAGRPRGVEPTRTFASGEELDLPGRPRAIHTPGHTAGHCAILCEGRGALFVGDALCTYNVLSGRRGSQLMPRQMNESTAECAQSLGAIEGVAGQAVLPGHGEPFLGTPAEAVAQARERAGR